MPRRVEGHVTIRGAQLIFRNFTGIEGQYNRAGDRNFCVLLDPELAEAMLRDGWNIKRLKAREEGDLEPYYIQVAVGIGGKGRPPKIVLISSQDRMDFPTGHPDFDPDMVNMLDWAETDNVDLIIRPYNWGPIGIEGKTGVKAYLKSIFLTLHEDELDKDYAGYRRIDMGGQPLAIEAGPAQPDEDGVYDGELVD